MNWKIWFFTFTLSLLVAAVNFEKATEKFGVKDIFCHGILLHTVQMAKLFPDSKTFVDMKLKSSPTETLRKFDIFMELHDHKPKKVEVMNFVKDHFEPNNQEFAKWTPLDWTEKPKFLESIRDNKLRDWASSLNSIWKDLGRQIKTDVKENSELYSLIWVPNPFIVPGGRFREFYYWDSYWIMEGLLLSEMETTVKGMLENFVYIVENYGHIPNGGRIYYQERSQPPFFIPMAKLYFESTDDLEFLERNINTFDKEFKYWMENHVKTFKSDRKNYSMAVYGDTSRGPRPESYFEDVQAAKPLKTIQQKEAFYSELKAAAESGWDFSSRWFISNETDTHLIHTKTKSIIPVDLNSLLYWNAIILKDFHEKLGSDNFRYYEQVSQQFLQTIDELLWDQEDGTWYDFDLINMEKKKNFYPSNIVPLFTNSYPKDKQSEIVRRTLKYLRDVGLPEYQGGVPTSLQQTGEQWDFPNAWPPLQHMMIIGLHQTGDKHAQRFAYELAEKWVRSNYESYKLSNAMFEKYDAVSFGGHGGGGEYDVQLGFGWSNGVVMSLLNLYGQEITLYEEDLYTNYGIVLNIQEGLEKEELYYFGNTSNIFASATTAVVCSIISLIIGYIGFSIFKRNSSGWQQAKCKKRPSKNQYTELKCIQEVQT